MISICFKQFYTYFTNIADSRTSIEYIVNISKVLKYGWREFIFFPTIFVVDIFLCCKDDESVLWVTLTYDSLVQMGVDIPVINRFECT